MIQHKTILLSWVLVHIVEQLEHPGPVCILLHGRWADRKSFQTIIDHYEQKQQPRVAFDLPGFGQSSIPPLDRWVSDYTSCVYEYILKKNLQDLILVWHSFGGQICIPLALSLQANLKMQIQTIILLAPAIVRHKPSMSKKLWYNLIDIAKKTGQKDFEEQVILAKQRYLTLLREKEEESESRTPVLEPWSSGARRG